MTSPRLCRGDFRLDFAFSERQYFRAYCIRPEAAKYGKDGEFQSEALALEGGLEQVQLRHQRIANWGAGRRIGMHRRVEPPHLGLQ
ncbi:MAG: hypothetical protein JWR73_2883 [Tardiphaga sp.]|nr:hypothetical protein [Tardiphaga sp.]